MQNQLQNVPQPSERLENLKAELDEARHELKIAEAALAEEQAAVNRFRMHCRLKIGKWVDEVLDLRNEKQRCLTELKLKQEAVEDGESFDAEDWFDDLTDDESDLLLPTDTPQDKVAEKRLYRELVKKFHPDSRTSSAERAYATTIMASINVAYEHGDIETMQNIAGQLDPELVARLSGGSTAAIRRIKKSILGAKRRRRKVQAQYEALRRENTARLWRKALRLAEDGLNWWDEVRDELQIEIDRLKPDVGRLKAAVDTLDTKRKSQNSL